MSAERAAHLVHAAGSGIAFTLIALSTLARESASAAVATETTA